MYPFQTSSVSTEHQYNLDGLPTQLLLMVHNIYVRIIAKRHRLNRDNKHYFDSKHNK